MSRDTQAKPQQTEKEFMQAVVDAARLQGWLVYHTHDSRRSEPGFPDLCMVRSLQLVFAELKVGKNKPTDAQRGWLAALETIADFTESSNAAATVEVYLWTPEDWPEIERVLSRRAP